MSASKFKIGDRLKALDDKPVWMGINEGDIIEIGDIRASDDVYVVSGDTPWVFADSDAHLFELVGGPSFVSKDTEVTASMASNPLYHYRASEETGNDAWGTLAKAVSHHSHWPDVKQQFKDWEVEYTSVTALPLPHAWRSAKSVIKRAFEHMIPITQPDGSARGKTAVEKDIKAAKEKDKEVLTPAERAIKMADKLFSHCAQNGIQLDIKLPEGEWHA